MACRKRIVLVACGSFNPITNMHLRMFGIEIPVSVSSRNADLDFPRLRLDSLSRCLIHCAELARDHLHQSGKYKVIAGIISPVSDAYAKKDLVPAEHRCAMIRAAVESSDWIKMDSWEAEQKHWTETVKVLRYHRDKFLTTAASNPGSDGDPLQTVATKKRKIDANNKNFVASTAALHTDVSNEPPEIRMLCGADVLESFAVAGLWKPEHMEEIVSQFGIVVCTRIGSDVEKFIYESDLLSKFKNNIDVVTEWITNDISATRVRRAIRRGQSIRYILQDSVIQYIKKHDLYGSVTDSNSTAANDSNSSCRQSALDHTPPSPSASGPLIALSGHVASPACRSRPSPPSRLPLSYRGTGAATVTVYGATASGGGVAAAQRQLSATGREGEAAVKSGRNSNFSRSVSLDSESIQQQQHHRQQLPGQKYQRTIIASVHYRQQQQQQTQALTSAADLETYRRRRGSLTSPSAVSRDGVSVDEPEPHTVCCFNNTCSACFCSSSNNKNNNVSNNKQHPTKQNQRLASTDDSAVISPSTTSAVTERSVSRRHHRVSGENEDDIDSAICRDRGGSTDSLLSLSDGGGNRLPLRTYRHRKHRSASSAANVVTDGSNTGFRGIHHRRDDSVNSFAVSYTSTATSFDPSPGSVGTDGASITSPLSGDLTTVAPVAAAAAATTTVAGVGCETETSKGVGKAARGPGQSQQPQPAEHSRKKLSVSCVVADLVGLVRRVRRMRVSSSRDTSLSGIETNV